ncbi:MAG: alpha/beta fold hydrolase [Burkholderiales bacterium]
MSIRTSIANALAALFLIGFGSVALAQTPSKQLIGSGANRLGVEFVSSTVKVNGATLHYVRGGTGPAVILVHGFPQDWYAYHKIMPRLAKSFTVIALDMRGVGLSTAPPGAFDARDLAGDIHRLAQMLKLQQIYVVGHDNGGMIAYTFARLYPKATRGVMILDSPLPGIELWEEVKSDPSVWHFRFHQTPDLPEKLLAGRQLIYFRR